MQGPSLSSGGPCGVKAIPTCGLRMAVALRSTGTTCATRATVFTLNPAPRPRAHPTHGTQRDHESHLGSRDRRLPKVSLGALAESGKDRFAVEGPGADRQDRPDQDEHDQVAQHDLAESEGRLPAEELGDRDTDDGQ